MRKSVLAAFAAFFVASSAMADATPPTMDETFKMLGDQLAQMERTLRPDCLPLEAAKEKITAATLAFDVLSGDRAARALALVKSDGGAPEETDTIVIGVVLAEDNDVDLVFFFGSAGSICTAIKIPHEAAIKVFNHVYGYRT